jgi:putative hydrolase of the HAD superfamily
LRIHPSAIIFDYGMVLCQPQPLSDRQAMAAVLNMDQVAFDATYWQFRLAFDEAALDAEAYWSRVARRLISSKELEDLTAIDNRSWTHPDSFMIDWARRLRAAGMRTAILSNMPLPVREYLDTVDWLPEFDCRTFSCDVRLAKPGPEIYRHCLRALACSPSDSLFLDDRLENVRGAEAVGIHSILFTSPADLAQHLDRRFATPVPLIATLKEGDEKNN